jgi:hypothetical protein
MSEFVVVSRLESVDPLLFLLKDRVRPSHSKSCVIRRTCLSFGISNWSSVLSLLGSSDDDEHGSPNSNSTTTMRLLLSSLVALTALVATSDAFSLNNQNKGLYVPADNQILSQKEVTRMTTRRDTIQMPTQTPMVPWTVRRVIIIMI